MKKSGYFFFLTGLLFLIGCDSNPAIESLVEELQTTIVLPSSTDQNLRLLTSVSLQNADVTLQWQSSNEAVIEPNGTIHPHFEETEAHIQAMMTYGKDQILIDFGIIKVVPISYVDFAYLVKQKIVLPDETNENLILPNSVLLEENVVLLTWESSLPDVLSADGNINVPLTDTVVSLSVTAVYNTRLITFVFKEIIVLAKTSSDIINEAKAKVNLPLETNTDITLPTNIDGVAISWFSSNPAALTNKGQWLYQETNTDIILTAVFSYNSIYVEQEYPLTVLTYTNEERLLMAYYYLSLPETADQNLELQVAFDYGVTASWSSNKPNIISATGVVTLNEAENLITLTATLRSGEETMEKQFEITTKAINPNETYFSGHMYTHRINDFTLDDNNDLTTDDAKVVLKANSLLGTYESKVITTLPFTRLVGSWSALSSKDATVELQIKVLVNDVWSSYLSYSKWGFGLQNAMFDQNGGVASMSDDELIINNTNKATAFQFKVTLRRTNITTPSPKLWLVGMALTIPDYIFNVDTSSLPDFIDYDVPQLYQHDVPTIGGSICSITSSTMLLLYHGHLFTNPLPHQETSPLFKDYGNNIYGNWVFNTVGISSYGETSYVKKIYSFDELRYHLVHFGPVALSIKGSTGLYTTNGHLIVVRGYEIIGQETYVITNDPNLQSVYYKYPLSTFLGFTRNVLYVVE